MGTGMNKVVLAFTGVVATVLVFGTTMAAKEVKPSCGPPGTWCVIGTTHATNAADHDAIVVKGSHDDFRKIKFRVKDAPLNLRRMIVTYDNGTKEDINTRDDIPKGGESRDIDLHGGQRSLKRIDFWYDTKGWMNGTADVTVYGLR
jgi:hypothetical protein